MPKNNLVYEIGWNLVSVRETITLENFIMSFKSNNNLKISLCYKFENSYSKMNLSDELNPETGYMIKIDNLD